MSSSKSAISADGTPIAFSAEGNGPPLILVEPAAHFRAFSAFTGLVPLLIDRFTVITYDRRGRGESGDAPDYMPLREVEDLDAIIAAIGGPVFAYGYSSGALLALHAAAAGSAIRALALLEPPVELDRPPTGDPLTQELEVLLSEGGREAAVEHFHRAIGVPDDMIDAMRGSEAWSMMTSVAPTLVHDCRISEATTRELLASVNIPAHVFDSAGSTDDLTGSAAAVARLLPDARHTSLEGEWHGVAPELIAAELIGFFGSHAPADRREREGDT